MQGHTSSLPGLTNCLGPGLEGQEQREAGCAMQALGSVGRNLGASAKTCSFWEGTACGRGFLSLEGEQAVVWGRGQGEVVRVSTTLPAPC